MQFSTRLGCALLLLLLGACRSQQTAFFFQPATNSSALVATVAPPPAPAATKPVEAVQPRPAAYHARPHLQTPGATVSAQTSIRNSLVAQRSARQRRHQEAAAVSRPRQATRHDALHIVLGALLVVGGIVAGLTLGGWLGLGVGAVIVLLGYYFVVLGIGGKHAWLEIFQEFFNM
ncbi:hypothetical protein [Hymenobacter pini]|uniref:hypothetical protein n=1 Tax=Hymenobacter pini TaxID=2880879 RepID=UPI001CF0F5DA|nr:hypothetical protein [Hymenobacter pini]MCA8833188.1 hypothetical protein [Hymenobacter pini]